MIQLNLYEAKAKQHLAELQMQQIKQMQGLEREKYLLLEKVDLGKAENALQQAALEAKFWSENIGNLGLQNSDKLNTNQDNMAAGINRSSNSVDPTLQALVEHQQQAYSALADS